MEEEELSGDVAVAVGPGVGTTVPEGPVEDELEEDELEVEDVVVTGGVLVPVTDGLCEGGAEVWLDELDETTVVPGGTGVGNVGRGTVGTGIPVEEMPVVGLPLPLPVLEPLPVTVVLSAMIGMKA